MINKKLKQYFNFESFKSGQSEVVDSILNKKDVVALMPTGGGKSLCYQLPAIVNEGVTVVISPLIALMKDQVDSLQARGISAVAINSSLDYTDILEVIRNARDNKIKLLYIAPERLKSPGFLELFYEVQVDFVAVDEAHCVSSWGHDFRPDYMLIKKFIAGFRKRPVVAAFTATATLEVRKDIIEHLGLDEPQVFVRGFDRPNLTFIVSDGLKERERESELLKLVTEMKGSGIIYALTRKKTEEIATLLKRNGIKAIAYHAGLNNYIRGKVQEDFMEDKYKVIVATVAFGMGVNKADIRFVIHFGMPGSLENYYQEAGRAGRDGLPAQCILLNAGRDKSLHYFFIKKSRDDMVEQRKSKLEIDTFLEIKYEKLRKMIDYIERKDCRRKMILEYFTDPDIKNYASNCEACDVCLDYHSKKEAFEVEPIEKPKNKWVGVSEHDGISKTIEMTIELYKLNHTIEQIAKIREIGKRTIWDHLIIWYGFGGDFNISEHITEVEEQEILKAIQRVGYDKLRPIKDIVAPDISYEKIKIVIAKINRSKKVS